MRVLVIGRTGQIATELLRAPGRGRARVAGAGAAEFDLTDAAAGRRGLRPLPAGGGGQLRRLYRGRQGRGAARPGLRGERHRPAPAGRGGGPRRHPGGALSPPTTSSTARRTRPMPRPMRRTRSAPMAPRSWRASCCCTSRSRARDAPHRLGLLAASAAISSRPCCASARNGRRCAWSPTSTARRPSPPTWPMPPSRCCRASSPRRRAIRSSASPI